MQTRLFFNGNNTVKTKLLKKTRVFDLMNPKWFCIIFVEMESSGKNNNKGGMDMANIFDFTGRVAVITGCSTGLGVQMAKALANQGCDIVAIARRQNLA